MRRIIANMSAAACALLLAAPVLKAETTVNNDATSEVLQMSPSEVPQMSPSDEANDDASVDATTEATYNRWVCHAQPRSFHARRFFGYSQWFQGGSGAGQQAHQFAYQRALSNCRSRYGRRCYSDFQRDCRVDRR